MSQENGGAAPSAANAEPSAPVNSMPVGGPPPCEVMGRYQMFMGDEDSLGEGTSSICRKGRDQETGQSVAIKVYKTKRGSRSRSEQDVIKTKFVRQIAVLRELQTPLLPPEDATLWDKALDGVPPTQLFMQLIDFSKDKDGNPGPDPKDGVMYVITELASYSLKDYIKLRREQGKPMSKETVRSIAKAVVLVTAGLHAKGLVHLDLKPENLMVFNQRLKLIDVDGCVRIGTSASINDSSLSFSPCYCAPEWARFLIEDSDDPRIDIHPALDVWSIGMTIVELVLLDAALKPTYASFMRHGRSHREAGFLFMDWLSSLKRAPVLSKLPRFDPALMAMLEECLLVCDSKKRRSLAQSLAHPYFTNTFMKKSQTGPLQEAEADMPLEAARERKPRLEDHSDAFLFQGRLWKLNVDGNAKDQNHWMKRDMWIANDGSLCYFSLKEDKRLVLLDAHKISTSAIAPYTGGAREPAFVIRSHPDHDDEDAAHDETVLATESAAEYDAWISAIERVKVEALRTMRLGPDMAQDLRNHRLAVKNRRLKVDKGSSSEEDFAPVFQAKLWKMKADGDRLNPKDWFERDMWLSRNGSLVYYSKREDRELVYYTHSDVASAVVSCIPDAESCKPWAFSVQLASASDGMVFTPGDFAAESEEMRDSWMGEFQKIAAMTRAEGDRSS